MGPSIDPVDQLRQALASGDLAAARAAFQVLETSVLSLVDGQRQQHLGRLLDMGQAAAETAHELRQPLSAVKSFAQLLLLAADLPEKLGKRAKVIVENAERMEAYVERLSRYSQGVGLENAPEACDVNEAIEAAITLLRLEKKHSITLERALTPQLPPIQADPISLQQIFINLLGNARQAFGDRDGRIRVHTRLTNGVLEAWVMDDGPGVPAERHANLFEPFVTHKPDGTGLGLSISRRIAEQHGGRLDLLDTSPGATFCLQLPVGGPR